MNEAQNAIIIMFSGGLDAAYTLHYYLKNTQDKIYAHHIDFRRAHGSLEVAAESRASKVLREQFMKTHRAFSYSESAIEALHLDTSDGAEYQILAGVQLGKAIIRNLPGTILLTMGWRGLGVNYFKRKAAQGQYGEPRRLFRALVHTAPKEYQDRFKLRLVHPFRRKTKIELAQELYDANPNLLRSVWSCEWPVKGDRGELVPCRVCSKCIELKGALDGVNY